MSSVCVFRGSMYGDGGGTASCVGASAVAVLVSNGYKHATLRVPTDGTGPGGSLSRSDVYH